jgi:hypothetical protein
LVDRIPFYFWLHSIINRVLTSALENLSKVSFGTKSPFERDLVVVRSLPEDRTGWEDRKDRHQKTDCLNGGEAI